MEILNAGNIGFAALALAFVTAIIGSVALLIALYERSDSPISPKSPWATIGKMALWFHAGSIWAALSILFYLIYTHQYQYHYVWSHSSNELPIYYMISCFWEGQEGSFLLWMFWHSILIVNWLRKDFAHQIGVLSVTASVQIILATMVLGAYFSDVIVRIAMSIGILGVCGLFHKENLNIATIKKPISIWLAASCLILILSIWFRIEGFAWQWKSNLLSALISIVLLSGGWWIFRSNLSRWQYWSLLGFTVLAGFVAFGDLSGWKVGSSPFALLKDVMSDAPIFAQNPNFIPANGNGLNPLLQNYWMVIHPPTLFLGFALTIAPFAYIVSGLITRDYSSWIKPTMPWVLGACLALGAGILLGGYWAYETLNFGGYWNWDPVENASLVPWLVLVAGAHTLLAYRQHHHHFRLSIILLFLAFLLVLYSTFLTRSGILGDTSVHTFTDLGLSGQLLLLLLVYSLGAIILLINRWKSMPNDPDTNQSSPQVTRELMLFLGAIVLFFCGLEIILVTSLPVINKLLGTNLAPPVQVQFFYYKWNVWFAIGIAALSAVAQYVYWHSESKTKFKWLLFKPFALSLVFSLAIIGAFLWFGWDFVYNQTFRQVIENSGFFEKVTTTFISIADELLILSSLFALLSNIDVAYKLIRKHRSHLVRVGGSLAHIGMALVFIGSLLSNGYERIVSLNLNPFELGDSFPSDAKSDNVLLLPNQPKYVRDFRVTYIGKKQVTKPIKNLRAISETEAVIKFAFEDSVGETFAVEFPTQFFEPDSNQHNNHRVNWQDKVKLSDLQSFIQRNLFILQPQPINNRSLYGLRFTSLEDTTHSFVLYPEAEINPRMGLLAHPDRKIFWDKDLYVHISSVPSPEQQPADSGVILKEHRVAIGDTFFLQQGFCVLESVVRVTEIPELKDYDMVVRAKLRLNINGKEYAAKPMFLIQGQNTTTVPDVVEEIGIRFSFVGANPQKEQIVIQTEERPKLPDYLTFKAVYKPYISVLWLGTILLLIGLTLAIIRRNREQ